ncbi:uncharacterized protein LOC110809024 [Carica papaya]|uniref:uncharacterized protein LOC110809024 n=1 Tax=Carica papaya TaxID=3649 RepID=UPI000B8CDCCA|nr:uncharacterized protein LOC110809024 [Carica papaya]
MRNCTSQSFAKMSQRSSATDARTPTNLRRSPRFLLCKNSSEPPGQSARDSKCSKRHPDAPLNSAKHDSWDRTSKSCTQNVSKKLIRSTSGSRDGVSSTTGSRRSPRINRLPDAAFTLRRSPRFSIGREENELTEFKVLSDGRKSSKRVTGECEDKKVFQASKERTLENDKRMTRVGVEGLKKDSKTKEVLVDGERVEIVLVDTYTSGYKKRIRRSFISPAKESPNAAEEKRKVDAPSPELKRRTRRNSIGSLNESMNKCVLSDGAKAQLGMKSSEREIEKHSSKREIVIGLMNGHMNKKFLVNGKKGKLDMESYADMVANCNRTRSNGSPGVGKSDHEERKGTKGCKRNEDVGFSRKIKHGEEGIRVDQRWTKEQELALQRAYFTAKPTPLFWKKVSKLVPGKSAQECFDKVHSELVTPSAPQPRTRNKKLNSSPVEHFSLSASKLLKSPELNSKRYSCKKRKSQLPQKTVRQLLEKHFSVSHTCEADLFSVLEPNAELPSQASPNSSFSTPKGLQEKQGFLQNCNDGISGRKRPFSRYCSLSTAALVSPPVLKPVKNKALHEKYIDQLHCREAKRKAEPAIAGKFMSGKENRRPINVQEINVVEAAKNAVSDVRDVISQLQSLQTNAVSKSLDSDYENDDTDGDRDELDL